VNHVLSRWNLLLENEAAQEVLPCCGSRVWASTLAFQRPFEDVANLLATSDRIWLGLSAADWLEAFQSHPRIGETRNIAESSARSRQWSAQEQSHAVDSAASLKEALAEGNREYEKKFQRVFIICATGKSAVEILENLQRRLKNDDATELHEAAEQQRQIIQIRVKKWLTE
jgi:2-oxo-4-hydroxy-4-carboxy-5-ureidoimidazoline decarboxylase